MQGQGEVHDQNIALIRNENTFIFRLNSNGWGAGFRKGTHQDALKKTILDFDIGELLHPKQIRLIDPVSEERFIYGKLNSCYFVSASWGVMTQKFRKFDRGSVAISRVLSLGAIIAFEKPYYYLVNVDTLGNNEKELFDASRSQDFVDNASFFYGLGELVFVPGVNASVCYLVDFSEHDDKIRAVEFGLDLSVFSRPLRMMDTNQKNMINLRLFIGYRFGKIYGIR